MKKLSILTLCAVTFAAVAAETMPLPPPQKSGGTELFTLLANRRSERKYRTEPPTERELSTLLWAGFGVNRADGRRTAPSAVNRKEITLYAILADGAYKYLPATNELTKVCAEDLRGLVSGNVTAPAYILLVADLKRAASDEYAAIDTGYISQNLYLAANALGMGSCAIGAFRRDEKALALLAEKLKLAAEDKPMLSQAVGHLR